MATPIPPVSGTAPTTPEGGAPAAAPAAGQPPAAAPGAAPGSAGGDTPPAAAAAPGTPPAPTGAPPAAPATYTLTLPEGGLLDESDLAQVADLARAKNWTNEQAQAALTETQGTLAAQGARFLATLQAHPEVGGAHLPQAQVYAQATLDRFLPASLPEGQQLRTLLTKTGIGNHPAVVMLLSRIGKEAGEDRPLGSQGSGGGAPRSTEDLFYGNPKP